MTGSPRCGVPWSTRPMDRRRAGDPPTGYAPGSARPGRGCAFCGRDLQAERSVTGKAWDDESDGTNEQQRGEQRIPCAIRWSAGPGRRARAARPRGGGLASRSLCGCSRRVGRRGAAPRRVLAAVLRRGLQGRLRGTAPRSRRAAATTLAPRASRTRPRMRARWWTGARCSRARARRPEETGRRRGRTRRSRRRSRARTASGCSCARAGVFEESVTVKAAVEVIGGFDCSAGWTWSPEARSTLGGPARTRWRSR